jgi:hypothetical protein
LKYVLKLATAQVALAESPRDLTSTEKFLGNFSRQEEGNIVAVFCPTGR